MPKFWNHASFVNISPTVVIGTWLERFSRVLQHGTSPPPVKKWNVYLSVSAVMLCKLFLAYTVQIDRSAFLCNPQAFKYVSTYICVNYMHISVSTSCIIEPSFFNTTSGMHRRLFEGRHIVIIYQIFNMKKKKWNIEIYIQELCFASLVPTRKVNIST